MRIVYIYRSLAMKGGVERILVEKANRWAAETGNNVAFVTYEQGDHPLAYPLDDRVEWKDLNVRVFTSYRYKGARRILAKVSLQQRLVKAIAQEVRRWRPDIVVCTDVSKYDIRGAVRARCGKVVVEAHNSTANMDFDIRQEHGLARLLSQLKKRNLMRETRHADRVVALTHSDAAQWKRYARTCVIPNMLTSVATPSPIPSTSPSSPASTPYSSSSPSSSTMHVAGGRIVSAGRLNVQKGFSLLMDAWKMVVDKHPEWHLDVYGDGEDRDMLERRMADEHIPNMRLCHAVADIRSVYERSDFYVMSSVYESFGLVLTEAMSCGRPCVAFDCPYGPGEIIRDGEDGLLARAEDVADLAGKMCRMIEDREMRRLMGLKAQENVRRFLPERIFPLWKKLFTQL